MPTKKYDVYVKEVWDSIISVEAESTEEALKKAIAAIEEGVCKEGFEYSRTMDPSKWEVREAHEEDED